MPATGNTTVPTAPESRSGSSCSSLSSPSRLFPALFLCWSRHEPDRAGEVAVFDPRAVAPAIVGREHPGGPRRVHFSQLRAGETTDGGPLTGDNVSHEQFRVMAEGDALRVHNTGNAHAFVNGEPFPKGATLLLVPGDVLEVYGNCVLLVGLSPLSLPPPTAALLPLHPFGEPDRLGIVGESWRTHQLREDIAFAASAGCHVFIHGPTGTGKELVARAIHALSPRARGPFVAANSASFTAELSALELFGSPKSYPNAGTPARIGYFERARGGTLLLDEIGEVLATVQAPLLRALDGAYNRVGDPTPCPTECVVILATNRGPASVKHDVLYRLGVTVETPALAERREDIPLLVRAALRKLAQGEDVEVDPSLIVGLLRSPLPGNVRELENIVLFAWGASGRRGPVRWPSRLSRPPPASLASSAPPAAPPAPRAVPPEAPSEPDVDTVLNGLGEAPDLSEARIRKLLAENGWVYKRVAPLLGINVDKLYRLRVDMKIHKPG